jgi:hypothetical protein
MGVKNSSNTSSEQLRSTITCSEKTNDYKAGDNDNEAPW